MVGTTIKNVLLNAGYRNLILKNKKELDLTRQVEVKAFFTVQKPTIVIIAAAKVGGIIILKLILFLPIGLNYRISFQNIKIIIWGSSKNS